MNGADEFLRELAEKTNVFVLSDLRYLSKSKIKELIIYLGEIDEKKYSPLAWQKTINYIFGVDVPLCDIEVYKHIMLILMQIWQNLGGLNERM